MDYSSDCTRQFSMHPSPPMCLRLRVSRHIFLIPIIIIPSQTTRAMWGGSNVGATSVGMNAFIKSVNDQRRSSVNDSGTKGMKGKSASHASPDVTGTY